LKFTREKGMGTFAAQLRVNIRKRQEISLQNSELKRKKEREYCNKAQSKHNKKGKGTSQQTSKFPREKEKRTLQQSSE
jgi:hypothetical protein